MDTSPVNRRLTIEKYSDGCVVERRAVRFMRMDQGEDIVGRSMGEELVRMRRSEGQSGRDAIEAAAEFLRRAGWYVVEVAPPGVPLRDDLLRDLDRLAVKMRGEATKHRRACEGATLAVLRNVHSGISEGYADAAGMLESLTRRAT